jgi:TolB-like protein/tetratricopeptide (TPR) repeat protein
MGEESPKPPSTPSGGVFLSYASQDAEAALRICEALRAVGVEVWFDRSELRGGDTWDHKIRQQIHDCALFLPIISKNTQARAEGYFRLEWRLAEQRTHLMGRNRAFLVPICVDATRETDADVPDSFLAVQWTWLPDGQPTAVFAEGIRRLLDQPTGAEAAAARPKTPSPDQPRAFPSRWPIIGTIAGALTVVVIASLLLIRTSRPPATHSAPATVGPTKAVQRAIPEKSVAVLPFADMSDKKDQEYLADGLTEEILDRLARSPGLKVCGRTSSFQFKHATASLADIGRSLKVANVLEGSIRRSGNMLRVTTQLIRVDTGFHIWSQTYARPLADILKVQDEIAREVATALGTVLRSASADTQGTSNVEAYDIYLKAHSAERRFTRSDVLEARALYRKTIAIDPNYVEAWAGLARTAGMAYEFADPPPGSDVESREAGDQVLHLAPDSADAQFTLRGRYLDTWNWRGLRSADAALMERDPASAVRVGYDEVSLFSNYTRGLLLLEEGTQLEPLSKWGWVWLCMSYQVIDRLADAEQACRTALGVAPDYEDGHLFLALVLARRGQRDRALQELRLETDPSEFHRDFANGVIGSGDEAVRSLQKAFVEAKTMMDKARSQVALGHSDEAFAWWYRAIDSREEDAPWVAGDPFFNNAFRQDPRFRTGLRKMNMPE